MTRILQHKCACGAMTAAEGECAACRAKNRSSLVPPIVDEVLGSPGQPFDTATRAFFEPRLGHDFSQVRVHEDARAAESARAIDAAAYTVGSEIVFGAGQYSSSTNAGRRLLAHELTHVVQQGGRRATGPLTVSEKADAHESEADAVARSVVSGSPWQASASQAGHGTSGIQRQAASDDYPEAAEEERHSGEVRDGDAQVAATPDTAAIPETAMLSEAGEQPAETTVHPAREELVVAEAGGGSAAGGAAKGPHGGKKGKSKPKDPPAKKTPPRTITHIDVDQAAQTMTVTWSDGTTESHAVSTGKGRPNTKDDPCKTQTEKNCTPNGDFKVGSLGNQNTKNEHGDHMSWYVELTGGASVDGRGIGIHDSQPIPGTPASHGCVRVGDSAADDAFAKKVNKHVVPGKTTIHVSGKAATKPWTKAVPKPKPNKTKKK